MPDPLGYLLTWTTYGSWLPGDERGWVWRGKGFQIPDPIIEQDARRRMVESPCLLDGEMRTIVENTIRDHCRIRNWEVHAVNCRSNHVHVVVSAPIEPKAVREQFKAWCTRRLREWQRARLESVRENWWTEKGSQRYLGDEESLAAAIRYVLDGQ